MDICGPIATGKTELARYLESKGYTYVGYSMLIADYLKENGIEVNRETLQKYGNIMFAEYGQYWLNIRLIGHFHDAEKIVVDGLRHPEDYTFLKEYAFDKFTCIYVETEEKIAI